MQEAMRPVIEAHARIAENMKPVTESLMQMQKMLAPVFKQQQDFIKSIERIEKDRKDTREVMLESGWWLTPSMMDMPAYLITSAIKKYKSGNKKAIFDLFKTVYQNDNCSNLEILVSEWNKSPYISRWSVHLKSALDAHKQKKYTLSVPMLLIVAEGVAGEYCRKNNIKVNRSKGGQKISKSLNSYVQKDDTLTHIDLLDGAITSIIYKPTEQLKSSLSKKVLNRHAILHGLNSNYGSMKTSLQAFMLIDMLSKLR